MSDESMVRTLSAQAEAIWPQEESLFRRLDVSSSLRILDLACGTGEVTARLADLFPRARLLGVDLEASHLARARMRSAPLAPRVTFSRQDAFELGLKKDAFDLSVCRHLLQAVPEPEGVIEEMARVTRPGGRLHVLTEDYGMIFFHPTRSDTDAFWRRGPMTFAERTGTDLRNGRKLFTLFKDLGFEEIAVDYLAVDTLKVAREVLIRIWEAWRDGYSRAIAEETDLDSEAVAAFWEDMLGCLRDPRGYAAWLVPVWTAVVP
jgi:SAM-dependent methyltransferase